MKKERRIRKRNKEGNGETKEAKKMDIWKEKKRKLRQMKVSDTVKEEKNRRRGNERTESGRRYS